MGDVSGLPQGPASAWGWTFRGSVTASTRGESVHLEVAGPDNFEEGEFVHVDALGRVRCGAGPRTVETVSVPVPSGTEGGTVSVLRSALSATADPGEMRSPLRTLLALFETEVAPNESSQRTFAVNAPLARARAVRAGDRESYQATQAVGPPAVWRGPVLDAAFLDDRRVVLLQGADLLALEIEESAIWQHAVGVSLSELAQRSGLSARDVGGLVRLMTQRGVLSDAAWWRIREDVVWTRRSDASVFVSRLGDDAVPLAVDGWGAIIWDFVAAQGCATTAAVVEHLRSEHRVEEDVSSDVASFLDGMRIAGLVGC